MDSRHHFIESSDKFGEYKRVLYCEYCGVVTWNFNWSKEALAVLQANAEKPCVASRGITESQKARSAGDDDARN